MFRLTVVCLLSGLAQGALAQTSVDVAVIGGRGADGYSMRLVAELRAAGLRAQTFAWQPGSLEDFAHGQNASAATRPLPSGQGLEVWMDERASGRPMVRHLVVDESPQGPDVTMIVLQTAELLRAGLRGQSAASAPVIENHHIQSPAASASRGAPAWLASGGLGVAAQTGGFSSTAIGRVGLGYQNESGWGPELLLQWPWHVSRATSLEGRTEAKFHLLALGMRWGFGRGAFHHALAAGVFGQWARLEGVASADLQSQKKDDIGFGGFVRAATAFQLTNWLRLGLEAFGSVRSTPTQVAHAERVVADLGRFGLVGLLTLEVVSP